MNPHADAAAAIITYSNFPTVNVCTSFRNPHVCLWLRLGTRRQAQKPIIGLTFTL